MRAVFHHLSTGGATSDSWLGTAASLCTRALAGRVPDITLDDSGRWPRPGGTRRFQRRSAHADACRLVARRRVLPAKSQAIDDSTDGLARTRMRPGVPGPRVGAPR